MEELTYFDVLKSIITKRKVSQDNIKRHFVPFQAISWVSIDPQSCYFVNELNSARGLKYIPKENEYKFIRSKIKLPQNTYLNFTKNDKDMKLIILNMALYYKIGTKTALDYIKILGGKRTIEVLEKICQIKNTHTTDSDLLNLRISLSKKRKDLLKEYK